MKRIITFIVILAFVVCLTFSYSNSAHADAFSAVQIGAAAYATMSSWGIAFESQNATTLGMGDYMATQVQDYVNQRGGTIADVFGGALAVDVAGKLVVGHQMYNALVDFKDWMVEKYSLSSEDFSLTDGTYEGKFLPFDGSGSEQITGVGLEVLMYTPRTHGYKSFRCYIDNIVYASGSMSSNTLAYSGAYSVEYYNGIVRLMMEAIYNNTGEYSQTLAYNIATTSSLNNGLSWNGSGYVAPTVIDPSQEWLGTVGDYQDTNLEQLLENILEDVEGNQLEVVGEVIDIDPPQPEPSPMPIDPGTPLGDVPWEGLDTNLQNLYEQGLEEIGKIGDAQDAITSAVSNQTGVVQDLVNTSTGAVSGAIDQAVSDVQSAIGSQTGVVSGAIDQAASDVESAIGAQTAALAESLSATAQGVETISEALEDETIIWPKFNLRGLFPFCIPFDIYNMLEALDASPTAPHVQLPFVIESIGVNYTIDLDFAAFDSVAAVMRQMELIVYGIALAWATSKVIKW